MKEEKRTGRHIDIEFFEMPLHRLLTAEETTMLEQKGKDVEWVSCKKCHAAGGTTDGRDFCSLECYCQFHDIDPRSMEVIKNEVLNEEAAKKGDKVLYKDEVYTVLSTDFSFERLKKQFNISHSYILKAGANVVKLFDLEYPLRKMTKVEHLKWKQNKLKEESEDENSKEL